MKRTLVIIGLILLFSVEGWAAKSKPLAPQPSESQQTYVPSWAKARKNAPIYLVEEKGDIQVHAAVAKDDEFFSVAVLIYNKRSQPISVEQERFFLLNKNDRLIHRLSEYELKAAWAEYGNLPPPPPPANAPPPRSATVYSSDGTTYRVEEDEWAQAESGMRKLGWGIGAALARRKRRKQAEEQIDAIEQSYFRDRVLQPGEKVYGWIEFIAVATSHRTPVALVLFIENEEFRFEFDEKKK